MKNTWFGAHFGKFKWIGWFICIVTALFYCYEYSLRIMPSVISLELRRHYGNLDLNTFGIITSLYYWAYTIMQVVVGISIDRYGTRITLMLAIIVCIIGNYLYGATHSIYIASIGRLLVGAGSAFAFVGSLKIAAIWLPKKYFPFFSGLTMSIGMISAIISDYAMTWIHMNWGWQALLWSGTLIGVILLVCFIVVVHEKSVPKSRKRKENSLEFLFKKFWTILKTPRYITLGFIGCFLYLSLSGFAEIWGIPFIKTIYPNNPLRAASINSMVFWGWFFGAPIVSFIASHYNRRVEPLRYGSFIAAVLFVFVLVYPHMPIALLSLVLFLFGVCCSSEVLCFAIARDYTSLKSAATAIAVVNLIVMISGIVLQPLIASIVEWTWDGHIEHGLKIYTLAEYREALIVIPIFLVVAGILAFFLKDNVKA